MRIMLSMNLSIGDIIYHVIANLNHVPVCCDHDLRRTDGWLMIRLKKY